MDGVTTVLASNANLDTVMILLTVQDALLVGQEESAIAMCHKTKQGAETVLQPCSYGVFRYFNTPRNYYCLFK